jgi:hypothetical protein
MKIFKKMQEPDPVEDTTQIVRLQDAFKKQRQRTCKAAERLGNTLKNRDLEVKKNGLAESTG